MSKAAATRWLDAHVGQPLNTVQTYPDGRVWAPGVRTLTKVGKTRFAMDNGTGNLSYLNLSGMTVTDDTATLTMTWLREDGTPIHTTVYTEENTHA